VCTTLSTTNVFDLTISPLRAVFNVKDEDKMTIDNYGGMNMDVKDDKCGLADLYSTVYKGLGIDPDTPIRDNLRPSHQVRRTRQGSQGRRLDRLCTG
jgi:hypothetical protein